MLQMRLRMLSYFREFFFFFFFFCYCFHSSLIWCSICSHRYQTNNGRRASANSSCYVKLYRFILSVFSSRGRLICAKCCTDNDAADSSANRLKILVVKFCFREMCVCVCSFVGEKRKQANYIVCRQTFLLFVVIVMFAITNSNRTKSDVVSIFGFCDHFATQIEFSPYSTRYFINETVLFVFVCVCLFVSCFVTSIYYSIPVFYWFASLSLARALSPSGSSGGNASSLQRKWRKLITRVSSTSMSSSSSAASTAISSSSNSSMCLLNFVILFACF
jgi:hypothetical protein